MPWGHPLEGQQLPYFPASLLSYKVRTSCSCHIRIYLRRRVSSSIFKMTGFFSYAWQ